MVLHILVVIFRTSELVPTLRARIQLAVPDSPSQCDTGLTKKRTPLILMVLKLRCTPIARRTCFLASNTSVLASFNFEFPNKSVVAFGTCITWKSKVNMRASNQGTDAVNLLLQQQQRHHMTVCLSFGQSVGRPVRLSIAHLFGLSLRSSLCLNRASIYKYAYGYRQRDSN